MSLHYMSQEGYDKLKEKLNHLMTEKRRECASDLQHARSFGDLSENAEYDAAKEAQGLLEKRIHELESQLSSVEILDDQQIDASRAFLGASVHLKDLSREKELTYVLVSKEEADLKHGKISVESPVGRSLLGKRKGDQVTVEIPAGTLRYEILGISRT